MREWRSSRGATCTGECVSRTNPKRPKASVSSSHGGLRTVHRPSVQQGRGSSELRSCWTPGIVILLRGRRPERARTARETEHRLRGVAGRFRQRSLRWSLTSPSASHASVREPASTKRYKPCPVGVQHSPNGPGTRTAEVLRTHEGGSRLAARGGGRSVASGRASALRAAGPEPGVRKQGASRANLHERRVSRVS